MKYEIWAVMIPTKKEPVHIFVRVGFEGEFAPELQILAAQNGVSPVQILVQDKHPAPRIVVKDGGLPLSNTSKALVEGFIDDIYRKWTWSKTSPSVLTESSLAVVSDTVYQSRPFLYGRGSMRRLDEVQIDCWVAGSQFATYLLGKGYQNKSQYEFEGFRKIFIPLTHNEKVGVELTLPYFKVAVR